MAPERCKWNINGHIYTAEEFGGLWDVWDEDGSWRMDGLPTLKRVCWELVGRAAETGRR